MICAHSKLIILLMPRNTTQHYARIKKLTKTQREELLREYWRVNRIGLLSDVARKVGMDRSTVMHTLRGDFKLPNPRIIDSLLSRLESLFSYLTAAGEPLERSLQAARNTLFGKPTSRTAGGSN